MRSKKLQNGRTSQTQKNNESSRKVTTWDQLNIMFEIITQPFLMLSFHILCNEQQCSFFSLPDLTRYTTFSTYYSTHTFVCYLVFIAAIILLGCLPIGGEQKRVKDYTYNLNGFNCLFVMAFSFLILESIGVPISYYIEEHLLQLVFSAMIFKVSMGIFFYIYSFMATQYELNPREIGTPVISAFYYGRQINPRLFNTVDFKFTWVKIVLFSLTTCDIGLLLRGLHLTNSDGLDLSNWNWNSLSSHPSLVVLVILHFTYAMSHLYYEGRTLSYYFTTSEGMGYNMLMANAFRWSGLIAQTRYIKDHNIHYPSWQLVGLLFMSSFGHYVYNVTNNQKDHLRQYPNSPESKKMKRIPTSLGKDILCDGWWGRLRQPNIMADILIHLTWLRFGFTAPPVLSIIGLFHYFFERARASQEDCKQKYGIAWQKYCRKVKYILVPFIY